MTATLTTGDVESRTAPVPITRVARIDRRQWVVCTTLIVVILGVSIVLLTTGSYPVPFDRAFAALLGRGTFGEEFAVRTLRLPRVVTAIAVGASLGIGGALFQSIARNPLGSPDVIGLSTGSASGALIVILVIGGSAGQTAAGAVAGGIVTAAVVYLLAFRNGVSGYEFILIGIGVSAMLLALNSYLLTRAGLNEAQKAVIWLTGSLNNRDWHDAGPVSITVVVLLPVAVWVGRELRMLELGDDAARALGVRSERVRLVAVLVGITLVAIATSAAGPVIFVALAAPQLARRLTRASGPPIVAAALMGSTLLLVSDLAAQRLFSSPMPVGVMTGAIGGLYLAWLLTQEWRRGRA